MTYIVKHRPLPGAPILAEYECENHGRIERLVDRDESGDPPERVRCGEYLDTGGVIESRYGIVPYCDQWCEWTISAPHPKVLSVPCSAVMHGGDLKDRPKGMLDTRDLADGKLSYTQWKAKQRGITEERRHQQMLKRGLKTRKVIVG